MNGSAPGAGPPARGPDGSGIPRWALHAALGFVIVTLVTLVLLPTLAERGVEAQRAELAATGEPSRRLVRDVQVAHARQMSALRGFVITEMSAFLDAYAAARTAERETRERLRPLARRLGPDVHEAFLELVAAADRWHASVDQARLVERRAVPEEYIAQIPFEETLYREALEAASSLEQAIVEELELRNAEVRAAESQQRVLTIVLVLLGLTALLVVAWLAHRLRRVAQTLDRRAREEAVFRRSAEALSAALGAEEAMIQLARNARDALGAVGAFVERLEAEANAATVMAASGTGVPRLGTRVLYPESVTQILVERNEPVLATDVADIGPLVSPYLGRACERCWVLACLLVSGPGEALGTLVVVRRPDRPPFSEEDRLRARVLTDLASLALRRGIAMEESERRREEVERLMRSKAQLMRGLSHDLQNPIGAVDGYSQLLEAEAKGPLNPAQREYVTGIRRSVEASLRIIQDVLELSKAEAGQLPVEREPVAVDEVVQQVVQDQRPAAEAAGLRLTSRLAGGLPQVETDGARVRQILDNLVSNAVKYTPRGGEVTVTAELRDEDAPRPGDWLAIDVADTGPGIPTEDRDRIFEEFYRRDGPEPEPGTGLGLAIARSIARLLGGEITLDSTPGAGSTFTLWLPTSGVERRSRAA